MYKLVFDDFIQRTEMKGDVRSAKHGTVTLFAI